MSFLGKVVIITGASSGIGAEIAKLFARESATLAITGRNSARLRKVADECENITGSRPLEIIADLANDNENINIVSETVKKFGQIDILINNAAVFPTKTFLEKDFMDVFDEILSVDLRAVVVLIKAATPHLIETKGNIVNISSILSTIPSTVYAAYCTAKSGLDHFSRCAALTLASKGVRVNTINPGPTITEGLSATVKNAEQMQQMMSAMENIIPLKKASDTVDVAELVAYIASDKAKSITGASYTVDTGCSLKGLYELLEPRPTITSEAN